MNAFLGRIVSSLSPFTLKGIGRRFFSTSDEGGIATKAYSAATTRESEFRRLIHPVPKLSNAPADAPAAFLLQSADFQSALDPLATHVDTTQSIEPLLRRLTSLTLQTRPALNRFNLHQARAYFARSPNDTGSPEVQCGQLTVRMLWVGEHCATNRHDYKAQRHIVELVAARKRFLRYLRRVSLERFYRLLDLLSLPPNYLEAGEKRYNFKYRQTKNASKGPSSASKL